MTENMKAPGVRYVIDPLDLSSHRICVTIETRRRPPGNDVVAFSMPVWTPGSYKIRNFARNVRDVKARTAEGQELQVQKTEKNRWHVSAEDATSLTFSYTVYGHELTSSGIDITEDHIFFNGATVFCEVVGSQGSPLELEIHPPPGWKVFTELTEMGRDPPRYRARDFDELIDSPVDMGTPSVHTIRPVGVPHTILFCGPGGSVPIHNVEEDVTRIVEATSKLFGGLPVSHYTFFYHLGEKWDGGLEHAASTSIVMPHTVFRPRKEYESFLDVTCHEYFHLFNVKRIRPEALGPFDYSKENYTRLLWLMEGTTDYYTFLLLRRAGLLSAKKYLKEVGKHVKKYRETPGRLVQSLEDASFDTWIDLYHPFEATRNTSISYYLKGELVSMCMDLEIRRLTSSAKSLDDVMRHLWKNYGSRGIGIPDGEIPGEILSATGLDLNGFFRSYVSGTLEIDFAHFLSYAGLDLAPEEKAAKPDGEEEEVGAYMGVDTEKYRENPRITVVIEGSPAQRGGLTPGDEIVALDGTRVTFDALSPSLKRYLPGEGVKVSFFRRGRLAEAKVTLGRPPPEKWLIAPIANPTKEQVAIMEGWISAPMKELSP